MTTLDEINLRYSNKKNKENVKTLTRAKASCSSDSSSSMSSSPVTWNDNWISTIRISYVKRYCFCLRTSIWNLDKTFWQLASEYHVFFKICQTLFTIIRSGNDLALRSKSSRTGTLTLPRPQTAWKYLKIFENIRPQTTDWLGLGFENIMLTSREMTRRRERLPQRHLWSPPRSRLRWFSASGAVGGTARSSPCVLWESWLCSSQCICLRALQIAHHS